MALEEYVGAIVMEVDGQEIEVTDLKEDVTTGRKLVKTMNKTGRAKGFSRGIEEIQLTVTVVIPESGDLNWAVLKVRKSPSIHLTAAVNVFLTWTASALRPGLSIPSITKRSAISP